MSSSPVLERAVASSMRDVARRLYRLGYVPVPLGAAKRPLVKWGAYHVEPPDRAELRRWPWESAVGVGVITGRPHKLVVVDVDDRLSWEWAIANLPAVRGTLSRRGGHLHFSHPEHGIIGNRSGARAIVIDEDVRLEVKGLGGMATAPGSLHPSGIRYRPFGDWAMPVKDLPRLPWLITSQAQDRLHPPVPPPRSSRFRSDPVRAVEAYLRKIGGIPKVGEGSDTAVFRAAAWARHNAPELRQEDFVAAVRRERPEFSEKWVSSKWRSAKGR